METYIFVAGFAICVLIYTYCLFRLAKKDRAAKEAKAIKPHWACPIHNCEWYVVAHSDTVMAAKANDHLFREHKGSNYYLGKRAF